MNTLDDTSVILYGLMPMKSEYRIGEVWGIPVNIHISLPIVMAFIALQSGWMGLEGGGWKGGLISVLFILVFEVFLFSSIALHELGHSFVAIRKGCRVYEISLMFIGGAAKMEKIPKKPKDEILMASAGPMVSLLIGSVFFVASTALQTSERILIEFFYFLCVAVGSVNILLAVFNLLPAFPMDGGRIFRAILTPWLGRIQATRLAALLGRVVAIWFLWVGIFGISWIPFLESGNVFLIFIAGFVFIYGNREYRMVQVEELMRRRGFADLHMHDADDPQCPIDENTVIISPPPYLSGPDQRTEIQRSRTRRHDRFDNGFVP